MQVDSAGVAASSAPGFAVYTGAAVSAEMMWSERTRHELLLTVPPGPRRAVIAAAERAGNAGSREYGITMLDAITAYHLKAGGNEAQAF